ncbi:MAG: aminopeptidase, partial [Burkholderiales bacterium]|nr:aminopeptidase [Burkholderiales bacterium]
MRLKFQTLLAAACLLFALGGCTNVGYYLQSVGGQLDLWGRERGIEDVLRDPGTPAALKQKLETVLRIREFASRELGLPDNASYRRYADLERPFVVWNVFTAPEFSMEPEQWCFLFAGCVGYRGYFDRADADRFAAGLRERGYDVFVGGVPAYSTLGWFSDPVLNTFIHYPDHEIARLIFHELAHQVVYVRDDTTFNESFAVAVELEGVQRWLARHGDEKQKRLFDQRSREREAFVGLVGKYRQKLDALYRTRLAPDAMRERKTAILREMEEEYRRLRADWSGSTHYDRWFAHKPNNAQIASVGIYTQSVPAFQARLAREAHDLP